MSGDWIKLEAVTPDKPEVFRMAMDLRINPEHALGCLLRVWIWADQQSVNGDAVCVTSETLDRIACYAGFATALRNVGWLAGEDMALTFPNFDRHNGETAKNRSLTARRNKKYRDGKCVTPVTVDASPEKRREENINTIGAVRATRLPDDWTLPSEWMDWAHQERPGWASATIRNEALKFADYWRAKSGKDATKLDWLATWRNWVRNARTQDDRKPDPASQIRNLIA